MLTRSIAFLLLLLAASPAAAQHCRVAVRDGGATSWGSGTLVARDDKSGVVLSCAHLFDSAGGEAIVEFPGGERFSARVLGIDRRHDLSALWIRAPKCGGLPLAASQPSPNMPVQSCGFGSGKFRCVAGRVTSQTRDQLHWATPSRHGDSGGGVFNASGELVGVQTTSDLVGTSQGPGLSQIRRALTGWCPPGGRCPVPRGLAPPARRAPVAVAPQRESQEIKQLQDQIAELREQLAQLQRQPGPPGPPGEPGRVDVEEVAERAARLIADQWAAKPQAAEKKTRVLYFTSGDCAACVETDKAARSLKQAGYPLTIITLQPRDTTVGDVPRVFVPSDGRETAGAANVITFLSTLTF